MRMVVCIEASHQRGMGHCYRGIHLARALQERGDMVLFVMNDDPIAADVVGRNGFAFETVASYGPERHWEQALLERMRPDWWINDRLDTDAAHARTIVDAGCRLATFDDHGGGSALARFNVLAMDLYPEERSKNGLYGPAYIVLNPAIGTYRLRPPRRVHPPSVLVTFGGSDTYGLTPGILSVLAGIAQPMQLSVVLGPNFRHHGGLDAALAVVSLPVRVHRGVPDLTPHLADADIVLCGGGITLFEAAALGVPALAVACEPHEVPVVRWLSERGACIGLGYRDNDLTQSVPPALAALLADREKRLAMGRTGRELVDGGGLQRIVERIARDPDV